MKERGSHAGNVTTRQLQRVISLNSSELYMKERSIHAVKHPCGEYQANDKSYLTRHQWAVHKGKSNHAGIVTTKQQQQLTAFTTSRLFMKERNSHAGNVTTSQLQRVISPSELYMKERGIHAGNVTIRQRIRVISLKTSDLYMSHPTQPYHSIHLGRKYHCNLCMYQPT